MVQDYVSPVRVHKFPFEMVMAAYERRFPNCKQIPVVVECVITEDSWSEDNSIRQTTRRCQLNVEAPYLLKKMIGVDYIYFIQKNNLDLKNRFLEIEATNESFASKLGVLEKCKYFVHPENPSWTCFEQSATLDVKNFFGLENTVEKIAMKQYASNIAKGKELIEEFMKEVYAEGVMELKPWDAADPEYNTHIRRIVSRGAEPMSPVVAATVKTPSQPGPSTSDFTDKMSVPARQSSIILRVPSTTQRKSSSIRREPSLTTRKPSLILHDKSNIPRKPSLILHDKSGIPRKPSLILNEKSGIPRKPSLILHDKNAIPRKSSLILQDPSRRSPTLSHTAPNLQRISFTSTPTAVIPEARGKASRDVVGSRSRNSLTEDTVSKKHSSIAKQLINRSSAKLLHSKSETRMESKTDLAFRTGNVIDASDDPCGNEHCTNSNCTGSCDDDEILPSWDHITSVVLVLGLILIFMANAVSFVTFSRQL